MNQIITVHKDMLKGTGEKVIARQILPMISPISYSRDAREVREDFKKQPIGRLSRVASKEGTENNRPI